MKVLIVGASGLVGSHLMRSCASRGWITLGTYSSHQEPGLIALDMTKQADVDEVLRRESPDCIFLTAFNANVDYCEEHPEETRKVNVEGNERIIRVATELGIKVVYYSSELVFDGTRGPYSEKDTPNPTSVYGKQKLEIETFLLSQSPRHLVIRTTTVYGWEARGKNFFCHVLQSLLQGQKLEVPDDQFIMPTTAEDLAEASCELAAGDASGVVHVAGPERLDRYDFAKAIAKTMGLSETLLVPVKSAAIHRTVMRPLKIGLLCDSLPTLATVTMHDTTAGLLRLRDQYPDWKERYAAHWQ